MAHNVDRWALLCNLEGMILISSITDFSFGNWEEWSLIPLYCNLFLFFVQLII